MRDSNYTAPNSNRAVCVVSQNMYDRRALDSKSPQVLLYSLTNLTYLTSTSPRIREVLTGDGGLERLLDILREASAPKGEDTPSDLWGLNGPSTARVITLERQTVLRHSLAFQCIVNIGVRGSENVRTRVVQSGALDLIAYILEQWLIQHKIVVEPCYYGSVEAMEAAAKGQPFGADMRRRARAGSRHTHREVSEEPSALPVPHSSPVDARTAPVQPPRGILHHRHDTTATLRVGQPVPQPDQVDTDIEMADNEQEAASEVASAAGDNSMDVDAEDQAPEAQLAIAARAAAAAAAATPRASSSGLPAHPPLPVPLDIPPRLPSREDVSGASSGANSFSGGDDSRGASDHEPEEPARPAHRPPPLNLQVARIPGLAQGGNSNQSSPMGTPTRMEATETLRPMGRRGTIIARPVTLAPQAARPEGDHRETAESGASDAGDDLDLNAAAINAGLQAAIREGENAMGTEEPAVPPNIEIVSEQPGDTREEPGAEALAAEQARLDMEAGAPPGQPGAMITPPVPVVNAEVRPGTAIGPPAAPGTAVPPGPDQPPPAAVIIAAGAPRGFHDLGSYVGIISVINPAGDRFADDTVLLSLQLLAYLSKYPHVRNAFHHPHRPSHPTFDLGIDDIDDPLPDLPRLASTENIFSLVERFTYKVSYADPVMFKIPPDIHYWSGVIMRNACRKDEARAGIRQCAHMSCGKWEATAREFAKCRRCRKAKYCSKECQSRAWAEGHRFWCNVKSDDAALDGPPRDPGSSDPVRAALARDPSESDDVIALLPPSEIPRDVLQRAILVARALAAAAAAHVVATNPEPGAANIMPPHVVAQWVHSVFAAVLNGSSPEERGVFYAVIRQTSTTLRNMFLQSMTNSPSLQDGIQPLLQAAARRTARLANLPAAGTQQQQQQAQQWQAQQQPQHAMHQQTHPQAQHPPHPGTVTPVNNAPGIQIQQATPELNIGPQGQAQVQHRIIPIRAPAQDTAAPQPARTRQPTLTFGAGLLPEHQIGAPPPPRPTRTAPPDADGGLPGLPSRGVDVAPPRPTRTAPPDAATQRPTVAQGFLADVRARDAALGRAAAPRIDPPVQADAPHAQTAQRQGSGGGTRAMLSGLFRMGTGTIRPAQPPNE